MRKRTALLIGSVLALLLVAIALAIPWRASKSAPATAPRPPSATSVPTAPPVVGADGIGDPYFPRAGNGGYDVTAYDIAVRYDPPTDRLEGHTTLTATATESLSRFNLDLRLPASAVTVNDQPATIHQDGGELLGHPGCTRAVRRADDGAGGLRRGAIERLGRT